MLLGTTALGILTQNGSPGALLVLVAGVLITLVLVWLAITAAVRLTRPWAIQAASAANLRTE